MSRCSIFGCGLTGLSSLRMGKTSNIAQDVSIGIAAKRLTVNPSTLRRWERTQEVPFIARRSLVGRRRYRTDDIERLRQLVIERHGSTKNDR